ncbi:MAG: S46 family peptidase [Myxococcales bacterium]|nr:MAG: S46 family peptidase [Myxococcales bacterium]
MSGLFRASSLALASFALACSASSPPRPPAPQTRPLTVPDAGPPATPKPTFENPGGMWLPTQVPLKAEELKRLGLAIDPALLANPKSSVLASIVNLNGCSASFVSKEGLVVTNHHCATGALQHNSTPTENLLELGMLAKSRAEERSSGPSSRLSVLSKMTDVTEQVRPTLAQVTDDKARKLQLEKLQKELVARCEQGRKDVRCGFVSYYGGLQYFVIETLEIRDVRIVYAPPESVGSFGGEIDNWRWPRQCGDFAFFRAYVGKDGLPADYSPDNVPYQPPAFLKLASAPLSEGDLVMVTGYPGHTELLSPAVEMQQIQSVVYPEQLAMFDAYLGLIAELSKGDPELAIKATSRRRGFDNYRTKHLGELEGMQKAKLVDKKLAEQQALRAFIEADAARKAAFGSVLGDIEALYLEQEKTRVPDTALERELLLPRLFFAAYRIARMAEERQKPDAERDPSYQERNVNRLKDDLKSIDASYSPKLDRAFLKLALQRDRARKPEQRTPALALIAGKEPTDAELDAAIAKLYDKTKLGDEKTRLELFDKAKPATLAAHTDPIVRMMSKLYPHIRAVDDRRKRFEGKLLLLSPRYMEALLAFKGGAVAPDANGTLRIAFGTVKKAPPGDPGADIGAFTTVASMVKKSTGKEPFDAPQKLLAAAKNAPRSRFAAKGLGDVPVDFLSDLHITNGNSGSATLNAKGELVGLAFDGTYESVASDWLFTPNTRSIHVDLRYILFMLAEVENAQRLLAELGVEL